jgi:hypothetical protein
MVVLILEVTVDLVAVLVQTVVVRPVSVHQLLHQHKELVVVRPVVDLLVAEEVAPAAPVALAGLQALT